MPRPQIIRFDITCFISNLLSSSVNALQPLKTTAQAAAVSRRKTRGGKLAVLCIEASYRSPVGRAMPGRNF
jgi:hypothetical protein